MDFDLNTAIFTAVVLGVLFSIPTLVLFLKRILLARNQHKFECLRCGNCCRFKFISLSEEDIKRIQDAGHKDFTAKTRSGEATLKWVNGKCTFLEENKCSIYDIRPQVCRSFPFYRMIGVTYLHDMAYCPGIIKLKQNKK